MQFLIDKTTTVADRVANTGLDVQVRPISDFLALRPAGPVAGIDALATRCVQYFDMLRAPPSAAESKKRRNAALTLSNIGDKEALAGGKQIIPTRSIKQADVAEFQASLKKILGK